MIGYLRGKILIKQPPELLLDVNGIGYEIYAPMQTFYQLPDVGEETALYIHLTIREDAHTLYGFQSTKERSLFRHLIKVNGIGPKIALAILSSIDNDRFIQSVIQSDVSALLRIPGIGKKTAERLVIEMRDKLSNSPFNDAQTSKPIVITDSAEQIKQDAIDALISLGYRPSEASNAVSKIKETECSREDFIRLALKQMMR